MKKQTAVEWLIKELGEYFPHEIGGIHLMVNKAKAMEREQIKNAYDHMRCIGNHENGEEYYEQTYGGENKKL